MRRRRLTIRQKRIRDSYTELKSYDSKRRPSYIVWLKSGVQRFQILGAMDMVAFDDKQEARWFQNMLAIAIDNIIEEESWP